MSVSPDGTASHVVSPEAALMQLQSLLAASENATRSVRTPGPVQVLRRSDFSCTRTASVAEEAPLGYVVNFGEGGYAVLGADDRQSSVVAVIEQGEMSPEKLADAKRAVLSGEEVDTPTLIRALVTNYLETAPLTAEVMPLLIPGFPTTWETIEQVAPMLRTKWGQWNPYNRYCIDMNGQISPAGCGPIAVSQILVYNAWAHGVCPWLLSYSEPEATRFYPDWSILKVAAQKASIGALTPAQEDEVAHFIRAVGGTLGTFYSPEGSGAFISGIEHFFNIFGTGYHGGKIVHGADAAREMLYVNRTPVYVDAEDKSKKTAHAWVLDGWLKQRSKSSHQSPGMPTNYFYRSYVNCNFGWSGDQDGLYEWGIFTNIKQNGEIYNLISNINLVRYGI